MSAFDFQDIGYFDLDKHNLYLFLNQAHQYTKNKKKKIVYLSDGVYAIVCEETQNPDMTI